METILIKDNPSDKFFHIYRVFDPENWDYRLLVATIELKFGPNMAVRIAKEIAKFYETTEHQKFEIIFDVIDKENLPDTKGKD